MEMGGGLEKSRGVARLHSTRFPRIMWMEGSAARDCITPKSESKETNPNPLDRPVHRSNRTMVSCTAPNEQKCARRSASVASMGNPPIKSLFLMVREKPESTSGGMASLQSSGRPSSSIRGSDSTFSATEGSRNVTNPKPRLAPVRRSVITTQSLTSPNRLKTARNFSSSVSRAIPPTKSLPMG